ncbi:hypothetical protein AGOR_G00220460 [Albula goreensis]|uniref:Fibronectin type-III domain-containing protein n=1 Tax=Albula goreensis TaxID=1534307 RepID=A0A8T3CK68_9TELE|nr:hypothetical protein AGOR_G00220460 [Albula goreensis]
MDGTLDYIYRMSFPFSSKICCLTILYIFPGVLASVPEPQNVRVTSVNLGVILEWDAPTDPPGNLTYTAAYKSVTQFLEVCVNQSEKSCDFTGNLVMFGIYTFHVRAELNGEASPWKETVEFSADKDTLLSPPTVKLSSSEGNMEVFVQDPVTNTPGALRKVYSSVCFNIRYWKQNETEKAELLNCKQQSRLVLPNLDPRASYCFQAQLYVPNYNKSSEFGTVTCETNTSNGRVAPWVIAVAMLCSLFGVALTVTLLFLIGWYSYKQLQFVFPTAKLPEHFKQYLIEPPPLLHLPGDAEQPPAGGAVS